MTERVLLTVQQFHSVYVRIPSEVWCPVHRNLSATRVERSGIRLVACGDWLVTWVTWPNL